MKIKRIDANQPELVKQIRQIPGVIVAHTHIIGKGFPDLVTSYKGVNYLWEVKNPELPPSSRKLTPDEKKFHSEWKGTIDVIMTIEDVFRILKLF